MAFHQSMVMPPTPDAANRLISMEIKEARLYYYKYNVPPLDQLSTLWESDFKCVGDVKPVEFKRDAVSFTQSKSKRGDKRVVMQLTTGHYTLQSFTVEEPLVPVHWNNDEPVMVVQMECHRYPQRDFETCPCNNSKPMLPLEKYANQMRFIRIEFGELCSWWKVSSPREGWTDTAVQTQLEQLFALYTTSTLCDPDPEPGHRMPFHLSNTYKLTPSCDPEASPWSEAEPSATANPAHPSSSSGHPPELPYFTSPSPPTSRALTSTLLHQPSPTSTILQHPSVLKRKLDEMIVHYDKIEEEEKKSMASCREKKEKLWADWRSTDPPTPANPQHPAGLKRKMEEMEVNYDKIEDEEKKVTIHYREKKEKLWGNFNKVIPPGHRDDNDRER